MSPLLFAVVAAAGGLGAAARFVLDGLVRARVGDRLPWGTLLINGSGSLLLGVVTGLTAAAMPVWAVVAGAGFLGGYTTFSTASAETVRLLRQGRWAASLATGPGQLVASVALAAGGLAVGRAL